MAFSGVRFGLLRLIVLLLLIINGYCHTCQERCPECQCSEDPTDLSLFTVICNNYNKSVLPACLNINTTELYIHGSLITSLENGDFENATNLKTISISSSPLKTLERSTFRDMTSLMTLTLRDNVISQIVDGLFSDTASLKQLDLSGNEIAQITDNTFNNLTSLTSLDLSFNSISEIEDNAFADNFNLERLSIKSNYLEMLSSGGFAGLQALTLLNVSYNSISDIQPNAISDSTFLQVLDLSGNVIGDNGFPPDIFERTSVLQELYISGNSFTNVPSNALLRATGLEILDMNGCLLGSIPEDAFAGLTQLRELYLSEIQVLSSVAKNAFSNLSSLEILHMHNNPRLSFLPSEALPDVALVTLKVIELYNNSLTRLDKELFANKPSLQTVDVYGNPFFCSCAVNWIRVLMDNGDGYPWIEAWKAGDKAVECQTPLHFQGSAIYSFDGGDLTCQLPVALTSTETHTEDQLVYEVLLGRGIPSTVWIVPSGATIIPSGKQTGQQNEVTAEEIVQGNKTVLARLTISSPTDASSGQYILQAKNAGGTLNTTFTVSIPTIPPPPGGLTGGQQAGIAIGVIVIIVLLALGVVFVRSLMRKTPYERMDRRGPVEEARGHASGNHEASSDPNPGLASFSQASAVEEGVTFSSGQRSYGGTGDSKELNQTAAQ